MGRIWLLLITLSIVLGTNARAQEITGHVFDSKTKEPIVGASVYYDGSSVGTITDFEGNFAIPILSGSNSTLVVRHLGYQTKKLPQPWESDTLQVALVEQVQRLNEIVLTADPFSRKEKMRVFQLEFLGDTPGGRKSTILNEDSIRLHFNTYNNTLSASSDHPIIIQNDFLGYRVSFDIQEFKIFFKSTSLERLDNIHNTLYNGSTQFFDISQGKIKIIKRRKRAYAGSRMHFMRACWRGNLKAQKFILRKRFRDITAEELFEVKNGSSGEFRRIQFLGERFVIYHKRKGYYRSTLTIENPATLFSLDKYGNCNPYKELVFGGYMSNFRLGDMLPIDYGL